MAENTKGQKAAQKPVAVGGVNQSMSIPRDLITVDAAFNVRRNMEDGSVKALAADIKMRGLLNPVNVAHGEKPGTFKVVAGFTRMAALDLLKWTVIPCTVLADTTKEGAIFANLAENVARESIPTFDLAVKLADIKSRFKMSANDIAARLAAGDDEGSGKRLSKSHINNLINLVSNLHPVILKMWEAGKVSIPQMLKVVSEPQADQPTKLAEVASLKPSDITGNASDDKAGKESSNGGAAVEEKERVTKPTENLVRAALKTVENSNVKMTENEKDALLAALGWVLGMTADLKLGQRVMFSPEQYKAALKAATKEAKEKAAQGAAVPAPDTK